MAHFSVSGDSIASVFIFVRIGFEPCNNYTLSCSFRQIAGPSYLLLLQDVVLLITVICLLNDPFFRIVASLKAMQCIKLRAKGRFSYSFVLLLHHSVL